MIAIHNSNLGPAVGGLREKNYSKTSLEENPKAAMSSRLKFFFAGIERTNDDDLSKYLFVWKYEWLYCDRLIINNNQMNYTNYS